MSLHRILILLFLLFSYTHVSAEVKVDITLNLKSSKGSGNIFFEKENGKAGLCLPKTYTLEASDIKSHSYLALKVSGKFSKVNPAHWVYYDESKKTYFVDLANKGSVDIDVIFDKTILTDGDAITLGLLERHATIKREGDSVVTLPSEIFGSSSLDSNAIRWVNKKDSLCQNLPVEVAHALIIQGNYGNDENDAQYLQNTIAKVYGLLQDKGATTNIHLLDEYGYANLQNRQYKGQEPTIDNIKAKFQNIAATITDEVNNSQIYNTPVYIILVGHFHFSNDKKAFLIDLPHTEEEESITPAQFYQILNDNFLARLPAEYKGRIAISIDSCYSGNFSPKFEPKLLDNIPNFDTRYKEQLHVLTSSKPEEKSFINSKNLPNGEKDLDSIMTIFTASLFGALELQYYPEVKEVFDIAYNEVEALTYHEKEGVHKQTPTYFFKDNTDGTPKRSGERYELKIEPIYKEGLDFNAKVTLQLNGEDIPDDLEVEIYAMAPSGVYDNPDPDNDVVFQPLLNNEHIKNGGIYKLGESGQYLFSYIVRGKDGFKIKADSKTFDFFKLRYPLDIYGHKIGNRDTTVFQWEVSKNQEETNLELLISDNQYFTTVDKTTVSGNSYTKNLEILPITQTPFQDYYWKLELRDSNNKIIGGSDVGYFTGSGDLDDNPGVCYPITISQISLSLSLTDWYGFKADGTLINSINAPSINPIFYMTINGCYYHLNDGSNNISNPYLVYDESVVIDATITGAPGEIVEFFTVYCRTPNSQIDENNCYMVAHDLSGTLTSQPWRLGDVEGLKPMAILQKNDYNQSYSKRFELTRLSEDESVVTAIGFTILDKNHPYYGSLIILSSLVYVKQDDL